MNVINWVEREIAFEKRQQAFYLQTVNHSLVGTSSLQIQNDVRECFDASRPSALFREGSALLIVFLPI